MNYLNNVFIALSQLMNAVLFGHPDETLAARCHRGSFKGNLLCKICERVLNIIYFWHDNHCALMHEHEVLDDQNSDDYNI